MITIAAYDPEWPMLFESEAERIRHSLGELALRVDHVGSTSVAGLAAKPTIDIQVSVVSLEPLSTFLGSLAALGYVHVPLGPFDHVYPYFCTPAAWPHSHHIHLCEAGSEQERNHLVFRNHLRRHPEVASRYVNLKRRLVMLHHGETLESQERYSLAKTQFIASILALAFAENTDVA